MTGPNTGGQPEFNGRVLTISLHYHAKGEWGEGDGNDKGCIFSSQNLPRGPSLSCGWLGSTAWSLHKPAPTTSSFLEPINEHSLYPRATPQSMSPRPAASRAERCHKHTPAPTVEHRRRAASLNACITPGDSPCPALAPHPRMALLSREGGDASYRPRISGSLFLSKRSSRVSRERLRSR